ncbi:MAG: pseudouridine synthase [Proteobacteria bacterium]|nr:pseudouridine synthase [Pseudomonadota bacterium]
MKGLSKDSATWLEVGEEAVGQRIDNFLLRTCKGVPKSHVYRILRSGEVRVNKGRVGPEYRLQAGDSVRVPPIRVSASPSANALISIPAREFDILFEDEALLVIDKAAGLAVHGGSGVSFGVIELLRRQRPESRMLELAHRLDRETSGLLIIRWHNPLQHVRLPLYKYLDGENQRRVSVSAEGKEAHSIVRLLQRWENFSLLEVELKTGRTHQIRVHLTHLGFPLVGDDKYGDFALNKELQKIGMKRMFLHAKKLNFCHPLSEQAIALEAPLPKDLHNFLMQLERNEKRDYGEAF